MSFLTAVWRKLAIANYIVDKDLLKPYIPYKTELDLWENNCYVSLIGFMFQKTKFLGIPAPFHGSFQEVNLRFYVRYKERNVWKRGAVFIKELVPKPLISIVANAWYKEHYHTVPMSHTWDLAENMLNVAYHWEYNHTPQSIQITALPVLLDIVNESETEFITEHYWGYTQVNQRKTFEYGVRHPRWQNYEVLDHVINADFGLLYGNHFYELNSITPSSVMLVEGSAIAIEHKKTL